MNLYLLTQSDETGYDTYDSAVVAAVSEQAAQGTHPRYASERRADFDRDCWEEIAWLDTTVCQERGWVRMDTAYSGWASRPSLVVVKLIGVAVPETPAGVICASFNAG
jgi:hypothetical protein